MYKISQAEINKQVSYIASLIAQYNPQLAQDYIDKPFHRLMNIRAFEAGFTNKVNAVTTEVLCRHIDLDNQMNFGK